MIKISSAAIIFALITFNKITSLFDFCNVINRFRPSKFMDILKNNIVFNVPH